MEHRSTLGKEAAPSTRTPPVELAKSFYQGASCVVSDHRKPIQAQSRQMLPTVKASLRPTWL